MHFKFRIITFLSYIPKNFLTFIFLFIFNNINLIKNNDPNEQMVTIQNLAIMAPKVAI